MVQDGRNDVTSGPEAKAVLTAEHTKTNTITEIMCRTSSENDVEQLAHETITDDSVPRRTLHQDRPLRGLVDMTVEATPTCSTQTSTHHLHCAPANASNNVRSDANYGTTDECYRAF